MKQIKQDRAFVCHSNSIRDAVPYIRLRLVANGYHLVITLCQ